MTKINYQALRETAEKATCGVWALEYGEGRFDGDDALIHREVAGYIPICRIEGAHPESGFDEDFQMEQQANAEFIAAANPATVLALLDERERNQQYIKRRDQENEDIALTVGKLRVELEAAEKRIAELEGNFTVLAVENASMKLFIRGCCYVFDGQQDEISDAYICATDGGMPQTSTTDAFLADVRAVAFNELRAAFVRHAKVAGLDDADTVTLKEVTEALLHCAEQIRAPE